MTNPTSNFNWQMPTPTDLVTDLPADFEVFGQAVDTSMADLLGGTTGQILAKASNSNMDFAWITNDVGDITAVNVTSPITGGGSSGAVTIGINAATTSVVGAVQLSDSTSTTSSVLASTPTATKSAYDLAAAAVPKSTVTTAGDVIYATGSSAVTRLGIGTAGQVLKVNSGATAPEWGAAPGGTFNTARNVVATSESTTSTSFVGLTTALAVTVTTGTKALVSIGARMSNGTVANNGAFMGVAVSGSTTLAASDQNSAGYYYFGSTVNFQPMPYATFLITGLTAGSNTFTTQYKTLSGDSIAFTNRIISVVDMGS
jgi:hypothetical protein